MWAYHCLALSSVIPPGKCQYNTLNYVMNIVSMLLFNTHPTIPTQEIKLQLGSLHKNIKGPTLKLHWSIQQIDELVPTVH